MAIVLAVFLFACSNNTSGADPSIGKSDAATSESPSTVPSTQPSADPNADAGNETTEKSTVGYLTDDVDYFARDPYHVTYVYAITVPMMTTSNNTLISMGEKMNFTVTSIDANGDMGKYIDAIEQEIGTGTDGFVFAPRVDVLEREDDLCKEAGLPYISIMTPYIDENGQNLCPTIQFDGVEAGGKLAEWAVENYSNYIEGVDLSSFGFMVLDYTAAQIFIERSTGFIDRLKEIRPDLESNIVYVDCIDGSFSTETGYNKVAATLSGHADIEYWIIYAVSEEFNVGACRAIEAADKTDDCLVVSTGCDAVFLEWDENASPEWVATIPIYGQDIGMAAAAGIVALMDAGRHLRRCGRK